jgi:multiple sugar transport system substrate-binding protein
LVTLRGMTWGHRRAIDPLTGTLKAFRGEHPSIAIEWTARPLAGFEFQSVEELAREYDLIVLDHPFMGDAGAKKYLLDLSELAGGEEDYVGPSLTTYRWGDATYAVPIDAACQVAAYRPDLLRAIDATLPRNWQDVLALGERAERRGCRLAIGFAGVHSLMTAFTLMASLGHPWPQSPGRDVCDRKAAREVLGLMRSLAAFCSPDIFDWNSIALHEAMVASDDLVYCPAVYCYATYAEPDHRTPLRFANLPGAAAPSPKGSTIGGTGLAVSAACRSPEAAFAYASYAARATTQLSFADHHGQPARIEAWNDPVIDGHFGGTFSATRATMEGSWIRPRYAGYLGFQEKAGNLVEQHLRGNLTEDRLLDALEMAFAASGGGA